MNLSQYINTLQLICCIIVLFLLRLLLSSPLSSSLVTGFLFPGTSPLEPVVNPSLRRQVSACSTFLTMCDVPSRAVFVGNLLSVVLVLLSDIF
jgi:hypothetical protein